MSRYDEDLYENPFFLALEKKCPKLFEEATVKRWIICVPQFSMVTKDDLKDEDFKDHILVPSSEDSFQTVLKHEVNINQKTIELGKGFVKTKKVEILFEETFYNNNDESYRVLCVSEFFSREPEASLDSENASGGVLVKQPVTYEDYMKLLWNNTANKTKDNLDKLLATFSTAYEKFEEESISSLVDFVSAQLTRAMQVVLKDPAVKRLLKLNDAYMIQLKVAVEMYMMNSTHKPLFSTITACVKSSDAEVNKMTRNLKPIRLKQLGVRKEFEENLPQAKMELAKLNKFSTPLGRLFCMKKVVSALTKPLKKATVSQDLMMTTDDFLPLLIYLIIKSEIPNWTANLVYMKHFHQAKVFEDDEFSFYLATTEAALDYLCSGKVKLENTEPLQKKAKNNESEDNHSFKRQGSTTGTSSTKDKFFQYVQYGDEAAVTLMLKSSKPNSADILSRLCHPLCTCEKCSEIISKNKHSTDMVSPYSRDDMGHTALHIAAMYGQAKLIDILVQHGSLPDASDFLGCTPLHLASQKGFQNVILLLVHFGSDISSIDNEGNTPLHMCAMNGHEDCVKAILFLDILKNRLNVNAQNDMGNTPLHLASKWGYEGIVKFLLDTEADPRVRNRKRQTPLNLAQNSVIKRELQMAFDILPPIIITRKEDQKPKLPKPPPQPPPPLTTQPPEHSSRPKDLHGLQQDQKPQGFEVVDVHSALKSPFHRVDNPSFDASSFATPEVASLDAVDLREVERLFKAIKDKDLPLVKFYLNWTDPNLESDESPSPQGTLCHPLCQCAKCQGMQKRSSSNLHVNCQNKKGFSPLHIAVIENNREAFHLFLKKGAKANIQTNKHITPLHLASYHCDTWFVKKLIDSGADVNLKDMHGEVALHLAAAKKHTDITRLLIQHSSVVNLANKDGNTPLHHACNVDSLDVARLLLEHGAEVGIMNKNHEFPADLAKSDAVKQLLGSYNKPMRKSKSLDIKDLQTGVTSEKDVSKVNVKDLFAALEEKDLSSLQQITASIKSFDKQKSLKRSKTFDKSALTLDLIKIPMSIEHFDHGTLKHVESIDKSTPMHIYTLLRSDSSYFNYLETPNVSKEISEHILGSHNQDMETKELSGEDDSVSRTEELKTPNGSKEISEHILGSHNPNMETKEMWGKDDSISRTEELSHKDSQSETTDTEKLEKELQTIISETKNDNDQGAHSSETGHVKSSYSGTEVSLSDVRLPAIESSAPYGAEDSIAGNPISLSDSYVVVDDLVQSTNSVNDMQDKSTAMNLPLNEANVSSINTDLMKSEFNSESGETDVNAESVEKLESDNKSSVDSNVNKLIAGYDNIKDVDDMLKTAVDDTTCSGLIENYVVRDASQSDVDSVCIDSKTDLIDDIQTLNNSDILTSDKTNRADKVETLDDTEILKSNATDEQFVISNPLIESVLVVEKADIADKLERTEECILMEDELLGDSDLMKASRDSVHREEKSSENITKMIDSALNEAETAD